MKKLAFILPLTVALFTGCTALDKALYETRVETTPPQIVRTNVTATTNFTAVVQADGTVTTNAIILPVISYDYAPAVSVTNLAPRAPISAATQAIGALPVPGAGLGAIALGWLYTAYAAFRNKRVAQALVTGIEAGRRALQETPEGQKLDGRIKDALIEHQTVAGVLNEVGKLVNTYTGDTVRR
jgi:hypothetical protein